jgi:hypothetical protein
MVESGRLGGKDGSEMACFMTDLPELDEHVLESSGLLKSEAVWTFRKLPAILSDWNPAETN